MFQPLFITPRNSCNSYITIFSDNTLSACQPYSTCTTRDQYTFTLKRAPAYTLYLALDSALPCVKKHYLFSVSLHNHDIAA